MTAPVQVTRDEAIDAAAAVLVRAAIRIETERQLADVRAEQPGERAA